MKPSEANKLFTDCMSKCWSEYQLCLKHVSEEQLTEEEIRDYLKTLFADNEDVVDEILDRIWKGTQGYPDEK